MNLINVHRPNTTTTKKLQPKFENTIHNIQRFGRSDKNLKDSRQHYSDLMLT